MKKRDDIVTATRKGAGMMATGLAILIAITLSSCEGMVTNVVLPDFEEKLVVECFLNPDDTVTYIKVATNKNIFGELKDYNPTGILSGTISNGINEISLSSWSSGLYFNHSEMPIEQGKSYTLKVNSNKGFMTESSCNIPIRGKYLLEYDTAHFSVIYEPPPYYYNDDYYAEQQDYAKINVYLTDNSDISNYYYVALKQETYNNTNSDEYPYTYTGRLANSFYSDGTGNGKILLSSLDYSLTYNDSIDSLYVTYYLIAIDGEYNTYATSFFHYDEGEVFTEVSPLYSNIKDGLGIFASYLVADSIRLRVK